MKSPGMKKIQALLAYAQPLILAVITFLAAARFAEIGVDVHHDGIMFKPALDMAEGKMLFRDTFTQYGALVTLLQALALKIFGHYLLVIKLQTAFFYALSVYFLWLIWKRIIPQWLATICGLIFVGMAPYYLFWWGFVPWSSVYSLFFLVLSLYLIILFIEKRAWYYILATGASVALTLWCRQPVGVLLFCALSFFIVCWSLFENSTRNEFYLRAALFLAGFAVVNAIFLPWLLFNHAFNDMWRQSFVYAFTFAKYSSAGCSLPMLIANFLPCQPLKHLLSAKQELFFPFLFSYVWIALPIACLILFFRTFVDFMKKNFGGKQAVLFAIVIVCLASWMQYYPVLCPRHVYWAVAPMIGVFAYFIWDLFGNENLTFRGIVVLAAMWLLFHADIAARIRESKIKLNEEYTTLNYPKVLKGMQVSPRDALYFQAIASEIDDYFQKHPEGGLINFAGDALYPAFVENLQNFHPFYIYGSGVGVLYPDYFGKLRKYVENRIPIIISRNNPVLFDGYTVKSFCRAINPGGDLYISAPADPDSIWRITSITRDMPSYSAPGYCLDVQLTHRNLPPEADPPSVDKKVGTDSLSVRLNGKTRRDSLSRPTGEKSPRSTVPNMLETSATSIRSLIAVASDFKGTVRGAWYPNEQTSNSITLNYLEISTNDMPKPKNLDFQIPADGKCRLWLTGQDVTNDVKMTIAVMMSDNTCSRQTVSILPPLSSGAGQSGFQPPELIPLRKSIRQISEAVIKAVPENAKIYLIWQGSNGYQYFMLAYELASHAVNRGAWSLGQPCFEGDSWTSPMTPEAWSETLKQDHYDYVVVGQADEQFWNTYGKLFDDPEISRASLVFKVNEGTNDIVRLSPVTFRHIEGTILPGDTMNVPLSSNTPQWIVLKNTIALPITSGWTQVSSDSASMTIPGRMFKSNGEMMLYRDGQFKLATAISGGADCLRNCADTNGWSLGYRDIAWKHNDAGLSFHFSAPGQINSAEISVQMRNYMDTNDVAARIAVSFENGRTYDELPEKKTGYLATNLLVWSSNMDANTNKEVLLKVMPSRQNMYVGIDGVQAIFSGSMSAQLMATNVPLLEIKNETPFPLELKKGGFAGSQEDWWESFFR